MAKKPDIDQEFAASADVADHRPLTEVEQARANHVYVPSGNPTNKWWVARITAVAGIATMWATTGSWDTEETVAAITLISEGLISWLTPNDPTPGGVPDAE